MCGQAVQVDEDVDLVIANDARRLLVGKVADDAVVIEPGDHALPNLAAIFQSGTIAIDLEAAAIMALEQFGHEKAHRVAAEIRRQVANPDPVVSVLHDRAEAVRNGCNLACNPACDHLTLHIDVVRERQEAERSCLLQQRFRRQARHVRQQHRPSARLLADMHPMLNDVGLGRVGKQRSPQHCLGFIQPPNLLHQTGSMIEQRRAGLVGLDRSIPGRQGQVDLAGRFKAKAQIDGSRKKIRPQCFGIAIGGKCACPVTG